MKYQWTDWITHVPGQQLLCGTYVLVEFVGDRPARPGTKPGVPFYAEGVITADHKNHPCWSMTGTSGIAVRIVRYKLRSEVSEVEILDKMEAAN